jgi:hypothetical protein
MKLAIIILALIAIAGVAYAQSTATSIQLGELQIINGHVVWVPISTANPLPVQLTITQ